MSANMKMSIDCEIVFKLNEKKILKYNILMVKLEDYTTTELKKMISSFNKLVKFSAYSKLKKAELINMIKTHPKIKVEEGANAVKLSIKTDEDFEKQKKVKKEQVKKEVKKEVEKIDDVKVNVKEEKKEEKPLTATKADESVVELKMKSKKKKNDFEENTKEEKEKPKEEKEKPKEEKEKPKGKFEINTKEEKEKLKKLEKFVIDNKERFYKLKTRGYDQAINLVKKMKLYANNELSKTNFQYRFADFHKGANFLDIYYNTYKKDGSPTQTNPNKSNLVREMSFSLYQEE